MHRNIKQDTTLHSTSLSAADPSAASLEVAQLRRVRSDEDTFEALWLRAESYNDIDETKLRRFSRPPARLDVGAEPHRFSPPIDLYRHNLLSGS